MAPLPTGALNRLADAIAIATISYDDRDAVDREAFSAFHDLLEQSFPRLHQNLLREVVAEHSLLYCWPGSDPDLEPILFMSHIDVVPIEAGTEEDWAHPPFGGVLAEGHVWGRGTIDTKSTLMAVMEAIESLLEAGMNPRRSVYLAFGHDEEVGGAQGGAAIVALLRRRGVRFEYVLDEGGAVVSGQMFGIAPSVAAVGTAEKGMVNVELSTHGDQGHASMPRPDNATSRLCRAVTKVEASPYPLRMTATMASLLAQLADHMPWPRRMLLKNLWLFEHWVVRELARDPVMAAAMHTTQATTMLEGSSKANTLASRARAVVNVRLLEGDDSAGVMARIKRTIDDPEVEIRLMDELGRSEPVPPSSIEAPAFDALRETVAELFPDAVIIPHTVAGATDSRQFAPLCDNIYRFAPMRLQADDLCRIHGTDERLSFENYRTMVAFFRALVTRGVG